MVNKTMVLATSTLLSNKQKWRDASEEIEAGRQVLRLGYFSERSAEYLTSMQLGFSTSSLAVVRIVFRKQQGGET